jgi:hypothetical protein
VKVHLPEAGSLDLDRAFDRRTDMILSVLSVTDVVSDLVRRCREGVMKAAAAKELAASRRPARCCPNRPERD